MFRSIAVLVVSFVGVPGVAGATAKKRDQPHQVLSTARAEAVILRFDERGTHIVRCFRFSPVAVGCNVTTPIEYEPGGGVLDTGAVARLTRRGQVSVEESGWIAESQSVR